MIKAMAIRHARIEKALDGRELCDVLADMMHYAELEGLDFEGALDTAAMNFEAERGEGDEIEKDARRAA